MTDEQRTATYSVFAALLAALGVLGVINADEATAYGVAGTELVAAASSLMAAVKTFKQRGKTPAE